VAVKGATVEVSCVLVCVDFADLLAVTLPANARHFRRIVVATTPEDAETQAVVASVPNAVCHITSVFFDRQAVFNKGAALEESFDVMGRAGFFVVMDADIVLPQSFRWPAVEAGNLYSPLRRMMVELPRPLVIPPDEEWRRYPLHPQQHEFAGFFQLAHASDPVLASRPWYPTNWVHAGGCDSEFQAKWPAHRKIRPNFEVLHLGPAGVNWCGRASMLADGTLPEGSEERKAALRAMVRARIPGPLRHRHEKI
jgi:hypothetical protein